jgi:putative transposase
VVAIIDGNAGLRRAVGLVWPRAAIQRCCVHKLRNLERKAPKHALAGIRDDFRRIVYAANADTAGAAYAAFVFHCALGKRKNVEQALPRRGHEPARRRRLHEECRRRVKTQGSLPSEHAALVLLFSLVASGQIRLRRIDGWRKIGTVLSQYMSVAA